MALIILDRDGVINHDSDEYIKSPEEWQAIDGSLEAIVKLNTAGHKVVVATNQSGLARGYYNEAMLHQIHAKFINELSQLGGHIDHIYFCPHGPDDDCACRKPKPQMLINALSDFEIGSNNAYFIGDSMRDVQAAIAANCHPVLVLTGNGAKTVQTHNTTNLTIFDDLLAFTTDFVETSS